jgi:hypothetical protein
MEHRKRMRTVWLFATFLASYAVGWFYWKSGAIMASSEWNHMMSASEVKVRRLPYSAPFWALPLSMLPQDNALYRFEYYRFRSRELYSAHSFIGESFVAQSAKVVWSDGEATVYLDNDPIVRCDRNGFWHAAK